MRRKTFPSRAMSVLTLVIFCTLTRQAVASPPPAILRGISASTPAPANELILRMDGLYSFNVVQDTPETLFIDLVPATAENVASKGEWSGGLLTGYHLRQFSDSSNQPVVRVEIKMKHHEVFQVQRTG